LLDRYLDTQEHSALFQANMPNKYYSSPYLKDHVMTVTDDGLEQINRYYIEPKTLTPEETKGMMWFDSNSGVDKLKVYDGTTWQIAW
jgi:hypothetical protein